jgi:adenine-specific DNA-methyltransferase
MTNSFWCDRNLDYTKNIGKSEAHRQELMNSQKKYPRQALNKAFLKIKPDRHEIEGFKRNLWQLIKDINENESEEFHKNLVSDFLRDTYYLGNYFINTKGHKDLVIHHDQEAKSSVGIILEAKKPTNKSEMIQVDRLNAKALQELLLYFLRERIQENNLEIKHLIVTNIYEWFIFDARIFEEYFVQDKAFVKQFIDFEAKRLTGTKTEFFYQEIAQPAIDAIAKEISFTHFDLRDYEVFLRNERKESDRELIALFKVFSPEHLLKLPFANDSNSLDRTFYSELLHIMGLTETKKGSKKLIQRKKESDRDIGSLLENAIAQLESLDKISRWEDSDRFGENDLEKLFNVSLELSITWINRILFLKLLEAQLITYHQGDRDFAFLNLEKVKNYDDLNRLFFSVLARKYEERQGEVKEIFHNVPYLNSSLFEPTELEHETIFMSNLRDEKIPIFSATVLKDSQGQKRSGEINALDYLFEFLNAYDFSSEGSEEIQEENKTLINAAVLGLIFEKINGYKDGSFFTPGFITMYMCRETIRRAVLQKFNEVKGWNCENLEEQVYDKIKDKAEANAIINSLKICDPAVGSGHFLVSALNEIIAIKSELKILCDRTGKTLRDYQIEVSNDELMITDDDGKLFEYNPKSLESQRIQETLFHEKQAIIENCLFGVDINLNSVKICRLRLWIELLKNAYYRRESNYRELETLPNIDINIKCGNSLISRFSLDADLRFALRKSNADVETYRNAVQTYRNAENKLQKREMEKLIIKIKENFRQSIFDRDPKKKRLRNLESEVNHLENQLSLFAETKAEKKARDKKIVKLKNNIDQLTAEIEEIEGGKIYKNAFEWRFEFPEVLNNEGDFIGFDVIIGNPPYIRQEEIKQQKSYLQKTFITFASNADLYIYFIELGLKLIKISRQFVFITPNKWMRVGYAKKMREFISKYRIEEILDFGDLPVFEQATTYPCIISLSKMQSIEKFRASNIQTLDFPNGLLNYLKQHHIEVSLNELQRENWILQDSTIQKLLLKIRSIGIPLGDFIEDKVFYGIKTGLNKAFVIDKKTKIRLVQKDNNSSEIIKPFLAGKNIKRYQKPKNETYLILFENGFTEKIFENKEKHKIWELLSERYPAITNYLKDFEQKAKSRYDQGQYWWELRPCSYYEEFKKEKIIYPNICHKPEFTLDDRSQYANQKCFIIPKADKYLLGILNSSITYFLFRQTLPRLRGDFYEPSYVYFKHFPIAIPTQIIKDKIVLIVSQILEAKKADPTANTTFLEKEIDRLVYDLYGLTEEEIELIERETG